MSHATSPRGVSYETGSCLTYQVESIVVRESLQDRMESGDHVWGWNGCCFCSSLIALDFPVLVENASSRFDSIEVSASDIAKGIVYGGGY